jgi:hypothetical protein
MIDVGRDFEAMRDYAAGRLSDDEERVIEDRLARDPELVRELEQSLRLREGFEQLREQGYFAKVRPRGRRLTLWLPLLTAAAAAGVVALFISMRPTGAPSSLLMPSSGTAAVAPVATHFTFVAMRSGSAPELALPASGLIEFRAAPLERLPNSQYRVTLIRQDDSGAEISLGTVTRLALGGDEYVHLYADAARLQPGSYVLRVEPDTSKPVSAQNYPFTLRATGSTPTQ